MMIVWCWNAEWTGVVKLRSGITYITTIVEVVESQSGDQDGKLVLS